jgi:hypothetical protein
MMMATADKEAMDKRATKEAAAKRAAKEAAVKAAAAEEAAGKTTGEAVGATGGSLAPGQVPSVAGAKRAAAPSSSTSPAKRPYMVFGNLGLSHFLSFFPFSFFCGASFSYYPFFPGPLPPAWSQQWSRLLQM